MMKKKIINVIVLLAYFDILATLTMQGEQLEPKKNKVPCGANMSLTDQCQEKASLEKNEIAVVEVSENDLDDENFCDSLELLATCIEAEAGNQDLMGKRLVCDVIFNRVESPRFPDTIEGVISQKYHFSTYWNGVMASIKEPSDDTFEAIRLELEQRTDDKVLFFTAGDYNTFCTPAYKHGDHYFGY